MAAISQISFVSTLPAEHYHQLEVLLFFNGRQHRVRKGIETAISRYGAPEIVADGKQLRVQVGGETGAQCLFAIEREGKITAVVDGFSNPNEADDYVAEEDFDEFDEEDDDDGKGGSKALTKKLEELKKKYNSLTDEADKIAQAITPKEDLPGLLIQLESLSSRNGLILASVVFNTADEKSDKKNKNVSAVAAPAGAKILAIDLNLNGSQKSLGAFLRAIETNLRIMDVSAINFGERDANISAGQDFRVLLNAYYME